MQGLYSRQRSVERVQCRFHLGGDVLDEFCFQFVVLVGDTDGFLLLAGKDDEAQQYDSTEYQDCGKDGSQYAESDDDVLLGAQGVVLLLDGGQAFIVLLLQDVQFVLCGKRFHGVGPEDILVVGACHQSGIVCLAGNADESLVAFVYLGVVLLFLILPYQAVGGGITLRIHAEGVVIVGLRIKQVVAQRVVVRGFGGLFQFGQLFLGTCGIFQVDVHLQAFLVDAET